MDDQPIAAAIEDDLLVSNPDPEHINDDDWIGVFQRPVLPGAVLLEGGLSNPLDQVRRDFDAIELLQMAQELSRAHAAGVHRDHPVVKAVDPPMALTRAPSVERGAAMHRLGDSQIAAFAPVAYRSREMPFCGIIQTTCRKET